MKLTQDKSAQVKDRRGVALLIVLVSLAVLTVVIVAFLSNGLSEVKNAKIYSNGTNVKLLSQTAVNLVIGEIKDGTAGQYLNGATPVILNWASQPGMIRTYDNTGALYRYYKLYSSGSMIGTGSIDTTVDFNAMQYWYNNPAYYADLNSPVSVTDSLGNTVKHYPILPGDLNISGTVTPMQTYTTTDYTGNTVNAETYETTAGTPDVQGFWVVQPGQAKGLPTAAVASNPVPMPVQWLYVLQNGTVVAPSTGAPTSTSSNTVTISGATASNPIIGRIAFWTDDESSKININTASEGVFWDTPRVTTMSDTAHLAFAQPAQNEFQRYPGHPAGVCLSTVFGAWLPRPPTAASTATSYEGITAGANGTYVSNLKPYYDLAPKIVAGTAETISTPTSTVTEGTATYGGSQSWTVATLTSSSTLTPDSDRLYDSIDEYLFKPSRTQNVLKTTTSTAANTELEEAKFFITAHSRAPDVNVFNQPRLGIWPISEVVSTNPSQSALDQLIAFCTSVGQTSGVRNPFYFQRIPADPQIYGAQGYSSPTVDISIARNQQLLSYLRNFCSQSFPGFNEANTFTSKYNAGSGKKTEMNQILTEIFDYIRCTNLLDNASLKLNSSFATYTTVGTGQNPRVPGGIVVPSIDPSTTTKGFGRFPTVSQAALLFAAVADKNTSTPATSPPPTGSNVRVQAEMLFDFFTPSLSNPYLILGPNISYSIAINGMTFGGTPVPSSTMTFPANSTIGISDFGSGEDRYWGGTWGISRTLMQNGNSGPSTYAVITGLADFAPGNNIHFSGGTATVKISYKDSYGTTNVIQTIPIVFPAANFQVPTMGPIIAYKNDSPYTNPTTWVHNITWFMNYANFTGTLPYTNAISGSYISGNYTPAPAYPSQSNCRQFFYAANSPVWNSPPNGSYPINNAALLKIAYSDVVQSVQSLSGDIREIAGQKSVDSALFAQHPLYGTQAFAHSLCESNGEPYYGATRGELAYLGPTSTNSHYFLNSAGAIGSGSGTLIQKGYAPLGSTPFPYNGSATDLVTVTAPNPSSMSPEPYIYLTSEPEVRSTSGVAAGYVQTSYNATSDFSPMVTGQDIPGDWDNAMGPAKDGAYINETDEGSEGQQSTGNVPYYGWVGEWTAPTSSIYSPNREVPSAGMFGSLPTGVIGEKPWQTLLFRPNPLGPNGDQHMGAQAPPDYLLLDLFTMPIVEPYAISEPLSTAGRINMNYQILPFTYINRDTAVRAAMKAERMLAIPNSAAGNTNSTAGVYKNVQDQGELTGTVINATTSDYRFPINLDETMKGFQARFANNDLFRAPCELCSMDLIPYDTTYTPTPAYSSTPAIDSNGGYWGAHALTGDNSRERPYADIYPRLTTKSNTFTIHMRVQTLQQTKADLAGQPTIWTEGTDRVTGEYRGSEIVERYVDPNVTTSASGVTFPDYAASTYTSGATIPASLGQFYKFRVVSTKQFAP